MEFTQPKDFIEPILQILRDRGGRAKVKDIYGDFEKRYGKYLSPRYLTDIVDGDIRWRDEINRCRYQFLRHLLVPPDDPNYKKGTWELL
jgi:hypothetical protein